MNKLHWLAVIVCCLCSTNLGAQSTPHFQSQLPPKEFRVHGEPIFERLGANTAAIAQGTAPVPPESELTVGKRGAGHDAAIVPRPDIVLLAPPEQGFFSKTLDFHGIPIKAHEVVVDEALYAAYDRLSLLFAHLLDTQPMVISNLVAAGAELHIIGRDQVTTDLPEWRHDKGVPRPEYNGLTRDQRTRGMGGRLTSCGEENLLKLEQDRYRGRDICLHEFSHNLRNHGLPREVRVRFDEQFRRSLDKGLWRKSYAGSNPDEFFAELTMWYFGTHGDLHMTGPKPENGPRGLEKYDPEAYALLDDFYSGRIEITRVEPSKRRRPDADQPESVSPAADSTPGKAIRSR